jgi:hypothetical protein
MIYEDPRWPSYDPARATETNSTVGGLLALLAIFAVLFLGIYFVSPHTDVTHTVENTTAPAPGASFNE